MDQTKQAHSPADKKAHTRPEPARGRQFERRSGSDKNDTQKKGGTYPCVHAWVEWDGFWWVKGVKEAAHLIYLLYRCGQGQLGE